MSEFIDLKTSEKLKIESAEEEIEKLEYITTCLRNKENTLRENLDLNKAIDKNLTRAKSISGITSSMILLSYLLTLMILQNVSVLPGIVHSLFAVTILASSISYLRNAYLKSRNDYNQKSNEEQRNEIITKLTKEQKNMQMLKRSLHYLEEAYSNKYETSKKTNSTEVSLDFALNANRKFHLVRKKEDNE